MLKRLSGSIQRFSTFWVALAALIVFLIFTIFVLPGQSDNLQANIGSPDLSFYYSADDLYQMAEAYGLEGRQLYIKARYSFDLVWPLVYTLFLVTGISWLYRKTFSVGSVWRRSNLVPILGALFDYLENISASVVMLRYPLRTAVVDGMVSVFTMMKWVFVSLSFILLLIGLVMGLIVWARSMGSK